jgi:hypothetical protein
MKSKAAIFGVFALAITAGAQQQLAPVMVGMATNAKQLKQYTFKQRTEIYYNGDLKNSKLDEVHFNSDGERIVVPLGEQKTDSGFHPRGPAHRLIAKKIENKQTETKQYIERLMFMAGRYLSPEPGKLQAAMGQADITRSAANSLVRIHLRDFVKRGDMMVITLDSANNRPVKTEIETTMDDGPVSIVLTFDQMHRSVNYPGKTVVKAEAEDLEVRLFTYDYHL